VNLQKFTNEIKRFSPFSPFSFLKTSFVGETLFLVEIKIGFLKLYFLILIT